jgi:hypothetical protein
MDNTEPQADNGNCANNDANPDNDRAATVFAAIERQLQSIADSCKAGSDKQAKHNTDILRINRWTFCAVFIYALLTLGILIINGCQLRESQRAIEAANTAANAAINQARTARDTEMRQLRPYVNIAPGVGYNSNAAIPGATPEWHFPIEVENNGATQTKGAISVLWCTIDDFATDDPMKKPGGAHVKRFFGPKQKSGIGSCFYTPDQLVKAQSNTIHLHIAAKIIYTDTLTDSVVHITEFCVKVADIKGDVSKPEGIGVSNIVCNFHNCADDECPKEDIDY